MGDFKKPKYNRYTKKSEGPVKVKIKFVNGKLALCFPFDKQLMEKIKTINGKTT